MEGWGVKGVYKPFNNISLEFLYVENINYLESWNLEES